MTHLGIKGLSGRVADSSHGHPFPGEFDTSDIDPVSIASQTASLPASVQINREPALTLKMKIALHRFHLVGATRVLGSFYPHHTGATNNVAKAVCATNSKACVVSPV